MRRSRGDEVSPISNRAETSGLHPDPMGQQLQPPLRYGGWLHDRQTPGPAPSAAHLVLRIRLPDRPGALGAVASRIGAVGADIVDVIVARSTSGSAVDVFHVDVPTTRVDVVATAERRARRGRRRAPRVVVRG